MAWARLDDGFDEHVKIETLLDEEDPTLALAAIGLWTLMLARAHRESSGSRRRAIKVPGLIHRTMVRRYLSRDDRDAIVGILVKHGLWDLAEDGWMIHDFGDYGPTDKTREAKAEAGRKGAEVRWGRRSNVDTADSTLPSSDSTLPSSDSSSLQSDGKAIASDGSRASARRGPEPVTPSATDVAGAAGRLPGMPPDPPPADSKIVSTLVAEYVQACRGRPASSTIARVGKHLGDALDRGIPAGVVRQGMVEWLNKGQGPASLPGFIDGVSARRPAPKIAERVKETRCPEHRGYLIANCPDCGREYGTRDHYTRTEYTPED